MKTLYIECNMGAAGDMLMAALSELIPDPDGFVSAVRSAAPGVSSVSLIINKKPGNVILGDRVVTLFGTETVTDAYMNRVPFAEAFGSDYETLFGDCIAYLRNTYGPLLAVSD